MKAIHIRDIEPDTLERLKRLAKVHHRSLQGELHVIIEHAARLAPEGEPSGRLQLVTVKTDGRSTWRREEIYDSQGR
jgi:plasmid stability protein